MLPLRTGRTRAATVLLGAALGLAGGLFPASAADVNAPATGLLSGGQPSKEDWYVTIGAVGRLEPNYPGDNSYTVRPGLIFSIDKASDVGKFSSVDDNPSIALIDTGVFSAGPVGRLDWGRSEGDSDRLRGLGKVSMSAELGGFAQWYVTDWLRVRGELRYGMGGFEGLMGDLAADVIVPFGERWRFAVGPRLSYASSGYLDAYYGVTPIQSATATLLLNPLPTYTPEGGIDSYGATAQLTKNFGNGIEAGVYGTYRRLAGDAAASPITVDKNQYEAGVSLSYAFNIGKAWW